MKTLLSSGTKNGGWTVLTSQGFVTNGDITCSALVNMNLASVKLSGSADGYKNGIIDVCNQVDQLLKYDYDFTDLKDNFVGITTGAITFIQKDIAHTGSNGLSTLVVNLIDKGIEKHKETIKKRKEAAVVGGTVSSATGGNFVDGAKSAAFAELFNDAAHEIKHEAEMFKSNYSQNERAYLVQRPLGSANGISSILNSDSVTHSYFTERHSRSTKTLSNARPLPSMLIFTSFANNNPVNPSLVNCEP